MKIPTFENLSVHTLNQVARSLTKQTFQDGDYVIRQGEIGDQFYVIRRGNIRVTLTGDDGKEFVLNHLSDGETFGERALMKKEPRLANCISVGVSECYYLNSQDFSSLLGEIVEKLNELDEFRSMKSSAIFSNVSISRVLQLKKLMQMKTMYQGQHLICDTNLIYLVLDGCLESRDGVKYGPRSHIGDLSMSATGSFTALTQTAKVGMISRELVLQQVDEQKSSMSAADNLATSRNVEQEISSAIMNESSGNDVKLQILKERRISTAQKRRSSIKRPFQSLHDIELIKPLGRGTFGNVYLASNVVSKKYMALKCLDKRALVESAQHQYVQREIAALQSFNHPFIGSYYGVALTARKVILVLEYISGGELWSYLYSTNTNNSRQSNNNEQHGAYRGLSLRQTALYAATVLLALQHIHDQGYCYRDLKPENLLISATGYIKLVDFGFAKAVPFVNKSNRIQYRTFTLCGTAEYMSP